MDKNNKINSRHCKFHDKECEFLQRAKKCIDQCGGTTDFEKIKEKSCIVCNKILSIKKFNVDNSVNIGLKGACKDCVKERDYAKINTWDGQIRKKVIASWSSHGNTNRENKLQLDNAKELLERQKYKCNHCAYKLECNMGNVIKRNVRIASLDRIDVDIIGYGNGNAQWLCMSCNNGKNTMNDLEHRSKFTKAKLHELEIEYLEKRTEIIESCMTIFINILLNYRKRFND